MPGKVLFLKVWIVAGFRCDLDWAGSKSLEGSWLLRGRGGSWSDSFQTLPNPSNNSQSHQSTISGIQCFWGLTKQIPSWRNNIYAYEQTTDRERSNGISEKKIQISFHLGLCKIRRDLGELVEPTPICWIASKLQSPPTILCLSPAKKPKCANISFLQPRQKWGRGDWGTPKVCSPGLLLL